MDKSINVMSLYDYLRIIAKRKWLIIGLVAVSVSIAIVSTLNSPMLYRGEAVISVRENVKIGRDYMSYFPIMTSDEIIALSAGGLVGKLMSKESKGLVNVQMKKLANSSTKVKVIFMSKTDDIKPFLLKLLDYLNGLPAIKSHIEQEKVKISMSLNSLNKVIDDSIKLKNEYQDALSKGKNAPAGINPIDLEESVYKLEIEKIKLDHELSRLIVFEIFESLTVSNTPIRSTSNLSIYLAFLGSLCAGIFIALLIEYFSQMKKTSD